MDILLVAVLLALSASSALGWREPARKLPTVVFSYVKPPLVFPQPANTDPWRVPNPNPVRQTFPQPPNTDPWRVPNTNPGRQTFPQPPFRFPGQPSFPQVPFPQPPPRPQDPWQNPGRQQQGNQCQNLAASGDCRFYDCFNQVEQQCLSQGQFLVNDMQSLCQGASQLSGIFSNQGKQYFAKVSKCASKQMTNVVNSQSCSAINYQASTTLFGESSFEDCYWQNQLFCTIISNPQDSRAMVSVLFGGNGPYNPQFIKVGEHFQFLAGLCPQRAQLVFQQNFTNRCPTGTVGRQNQPVVDPTPPMMMMGGPGGD